VKNVLIVEDPGAIRSMMQLPVKATRRFFAVEAGNGFEALKTLPARHFNFIITDINSLKLISFVMSSSSHTMQSVVE
jgi:CheY-like chemotaxis protein